jgi:hypothetical protein
MMCQEYNVASNTAVLMSARPMTWAQKRQCRMDNSSVQGTFLLLFPHTHFRLLRLEKTIYPPFMEWPRFLVVGGDRKSVVVVAASYLRYRDSWKWAPRFLSFA